VEVLLFPLVVLVEAAVVVGLLHVGVRFGVRDGMTDFQKRERETGRREQNR
jgi:hypothetical protein